MAPPLVSPAGGTGGAGVSRGVCDPGPYGPKRQLTDFLGGPQGPGLRPQAHAWPHSRPLGPGGDPLIELCSHPLYAGSRLQPLLRSSRTGELSIPMEIFSLTVVSVTEG